MWLALRIHPFRNADATFAATAHPVDNEPVKETGEECTEENGDDIMECLPPCQPHKHILQLFNNAN